jgi:hypothetical protein
MSSPIFFLLFGLLIGLGSLAFLGGAIWSYVSQKRKMDVRTATTGTVVELVTQMGHEGHIYCPVVEFTGPTGKIRFTSSFGTRPASHRVGQVVNVRYDPIDPLQAEIESGLSRWLVPGILIFMGLIACCLSVAFIGVYAMSLVVNSQ